MQNKFTQPVSMQVTKEQYEKDLREPLLRMGYLEHALTEWAIASILVTNYGNMGFYISNTINEYKKRHNRYFIPEYNPKLFLAIAAMSNEKYGIYGEWWYCIKNKKMLSDGRIEYNKGKLYMGLDNERIVNNSRDDDHYWRGDYRFIHFRKATLQELITNFTEQKQENIMKKEITTELIEELKNLIAPENEEAFNKIMGIEKTKLKTNQWKFPCKGISVIDNKIVGFTKYGVGVVLDIGNSTCHKLYEFSEHWIMNDFIPVKEEKQPIDWDKVELPIWAKNRDGNIIQVKSIKGENIQYCAICNNEMVVITDTFPTQGFAKEWLNSLEVLPKGTKIEIII